MKIRGGLWISAELNGNFFPPLCKMMLPISREKQFYAPLTLNINGAGVIVSNPTSLEVVFVFLSG